MEDPNCWLTKWKSHTNRNNIFFNLQSKLGKRFFVLDKGKWIRRDDLFYLWIILSLSETGLALLIKSNAIKSRLK